MDRWRGSSDKRAEAVAMGERNASRKSQEFRDEVEQLREELE